MFLLLLLQHHPTFQSWTTSSHAVLITLVVFVKDVAQMTGSARDPLNALQELHSNPFRAVAAPGEEAMGTAMIHRLVAILLDRYGNQLARPPVDRLRAHNRVWTTSNPAGLTILVVFVRGVARMIASARVVCVVSRETG